jgi:hypothetical protein
MPSADLEALLAAVVDARFEEHREVPLRVLTQPGPELLRLPDVVLEVALQRREELVRLLRAEAGVGLARRAADRFIHAIYAKNEFLQVGDEDAAALEAIYRMLLADLASAADLCDSREDLARRIPELLRAHFERMSEFLQQLWRGPGEAVDFVFCEPTSSEYSAELQLELLGIDIDVMREPVLDVGCGPSAMLVAFLRSRSIEAYGVDRWTAGASFVRTGDWLAYRYGTNRWGTVIAHLSFSNHFVFHDRAGSPVARDYAKTYMAILRALSRGGSFYYAPALPFVERHLPAEAFGVTYREVPVPGLSEIGRAVRVDRLR